MAQNPYEDPKGEEGEKWYVDQVVGAVTRDNFDEVLKNLKHWSPNNSAFLGSQYRLKDDPVDHSLFTLLDEYFWTKVSERDLSKEQGRNAYNFLKPLSEELASIFETRF